MDAYEIAKGDYALGFITKADYIETINRPIEEKVERDYSVKGSRVNIERRTTGETVSVPKLKKSAPSIKPVQLEALKRLAEKTKSPVGTAGPAEPAKPAIKHSFNPDQLAALKRLSMKTKDPAEPPKPVTSKVPTVNQDLLKARVDALKTQKEASTKKPSGFEDLF